MSSASVTEEGYPLLLASMSFAIFWTVTAVTMPGPLLVDMSLALDTTVPMMGQLVTIAAATWAVTALLGGPISDAYGRKPVLVLGLCFLAIGCVGISLATNFATVTGFSVLVGIGGGMVPPTCIALVGDIVPDAHKPKSIAILTTAPGVSSVLGVPLTAVLGDLSGWRFPFWAVGLALFLAAVLLLFLVPRHRPQSVSVDLIGRLRWVASSPVTWYVVGTNLLARVSWGATMTFFPAFLIVTYGLKTAAVALPFAIVALGATAAPLLAGRISRHPRRLTITAALLLAATIPGLSLFFLVGGTWMSVTAASLFMLLIVPVTTVLSILFVETGGAYRGTLAGVISSTNWGGTAAGAAIGGVLVAYLGYGAVSVFVACVIFTSGLLMAFLVNDGAMARAREHFSRQPATQSGPDGNGSSL